MRDLPTGWTSARLDSILTRIVGGGTPSKTNSAYFKGSIPFMTVKDLYGRSPSDTIDHISEEAIASSATALIPADTLIVATRMSLGKIVRPVVDVAINQDLKALLLIEDVNKTYVEYFWRSQADHIQSLGTGTTVKGIRLEDIRDLEIPLPPSPEQTRIADKLDAVLARVDACHNRLDSIPSILKRFRQSVLAAATSGKLTEGWRELDQTATKASAKDEVCQKLEARRRAVPSTRKFKEPVEPDMSRWNADVPYGWSVESISAYAECLDYMRVPVTKAKRSSTHGLYPYYGANGQVDSVDEYLFDDELVLVTEDETFYGREKPIAYRTSGRCWVNNHAHVLLAGDAYRADYLCFALMYYDVLPWLTGTTGRAKLTQGVLNALPIAVPPQAEIEEIVRRVESLFSFADRLEARYSAARAQVEKLTPSTLAKAFRGELVPQDPNDEPACELLSRIAKNNIGKPENKSAMNRRQ